MSLKMILVWAAIKPKLLELIRQEREEREKAAFKRRLIERYEEVGPYYSSFVEFCVPDIDRPFMPNIYDACRLPSIAELTQDNSAHTPVTGDRFRALGARLLAECREYINQAKYDLAEMLRCHRPSHMEENYPALSTLTPEQIHAEVTRGSSFFTCRNCTLTGFHSAQEICTHWRTVHPDLRWNDGWPYQLSTDHRRSPADRPKTTAFIEASSLEEDLHSALRSLGLPTGITCDELDFLVRDGRIICTCSNPELSPPNGLSWAFLASHPMPLELVKINDKFVLSGQTHRSGDIVVSPLACGCVSTFR